MSQGTLLEAKQIMEDSNIRHLPVTSGERLEGIISLTDIHRISFGANFGQEKDVDAAIFEMLSLEQVMKANPRTITPETPIKDVAQILSQEEFHALPVTDSNGNLEGIVTTTDMMKYLLEQY